MLIVYFYFRQIKVKKKNKWIKFPVKSSKIIGTNLKYSVNSINFEVSISRKNPSKLILFTFSKLQKWTRFISFQSSKWTFNFPSKSSYINKNPSKIPVKYKANRILCSFPIFFPKVFPSKIKILKSTKFPS